MAATAVIVVGVAVVAAVAVVASAVGGAAMGPGAFALASPRRSLSKGLSAPPRHPSCAYLTCGRRFLYD